MNGNYKHILNKSSSGEVSNRIFGAGEQEKNQTLQLVSPLPNHLICSIFNSSLHH